MPVGLSDGTSYPTEEAYTNELWSNVEIRPVAENEEDKSIPVNPDRFSGFPGKDKMAKEPRNPDADPSMVMDPNAYMWNKGVRSDPRNIYDENGNITDYDLKDHQPPTQPDMDPRSHSMILENEGLVQPAAAVLGTPLLRHKMHVAENTGASNVGSELASLGGRVFGRLFGTNGYERYQTFPEKAVRGIIDAFMVPGDAYQGNLDPNTPEGQERMTNLAMTMVGSGLPSAFAGKAIEGTLGSFAGVKAAHLPMDDFIKAARMFMEDATPDEIWKETNWFLAPDGRWKFEIPNEEMQLKGVGRPIPGRAPSLFMPNLNQQYKLLAPAKLSEVIDHPQLFKQYPFLKDIEVRPMDPMEELLGHLGSAGRDETGSYINLKRGSPEQLKSVLVHEIQHHIQDFEGFSIGANKDWFASPQWKELLQEFETMKVMSELQATKPIHDYIKTLGYESPLEETDAAIQLQKDMIEALKNEKQIEYINKATSDGGVIPNGWSSSDAEFFKKAAGDLQLSKDLGIYNPLKKIARGEDIKDRHSNLSYEHYTRVKGEAEARNDQHRMGFNSIARRDLHPMSTFNTMRQPVAPRDQIWSPRDMQSLKDLAD